MLTVMTFNLGNDLAPADRVIGVIRSSGADVVALQELGLANARAIERDLASEYPHQALFAGGFPGKGVLSRYPISGVERLHLYPDRPDLRVDVAFEGLAVTFVAAHPPPPTAASPALRTAADTPAPGNGAASGCSAGRRRGRAIFRTGQARSPRPPRPRGIIAAGPRSR